MNAQRTYAMRVYKTKEKRKREKKKKKEQRKRKNKWFSKNKTVLPLNSGYIFFNKCVTHFISLELNSPFPSI